MHRQSRNDGRRRGVLVCHWLCQFYWWKTLASPVARIKGSLTEHYAWMEISTSHVRTGAIRLSTIHSSSSTRTSEAADNTAEQNLAMSR